MLLTSLVTLETLSRMAFLVLHSLGQTAWASRQDAVAAVGVWVPALTAGALGLVSRHHPSLNLGRGS